MKTLILAITTLGILGQSANAAYVNANFKPTLGELEVSIGYSEKSLVGRKLIEFARSSKDFKAEDHVYVEPNSSFHTKNKEIRIIKNSVGSVTLMLSLNQLNSGVSSLSSELIQIRYSNGTDIGRILHMALYKSESSSVTSAKNPPTEIGSGFHPYGSTVAILGNSLGTVGEYITCFSGFDSKLESPNAHGKCDISLGTQY